MSISKFALASTVFAATLMGAAIPMTASAASDIKSASDCEFEGGTMTSIKGSDYCLVQIRPEEYKGEEYDGNKLGVVDCPGSKLNDGLFCLYPVTVNKMKSANMGSATSVEKAAKSAVDLKMEGVEGEANVNAGKLEGEQIKDMVKTAPKPMTAKEKRAAKKAAKAARKAAEKAAKAAAQ